MQTPQLLNDVISLLLLLAPSAAFVSLVLAGIALRHDGSTAFVIGGGFTKWMFWAVVCSPGPCVGPASGFGAVCAGQFTAERVKMRMAAAVMRIAQPARTAATEPEQS